MAIGGITKFPFLSIPYAIILIARIPPSDTLAILSGILVSSTSLYAFSYIINDIFDIDEDRRAGKVNLMAGFSTARRITLVVFFVISGFLPFALIDIGFLAVLLLLINYMLSMLYSAPPTRLKEKMLWGVFADGYWAHGLPTLFIAEEFSTLADGSIERILPFIITATIWAFLFGLRGILIHQIWDLQNDDTSGLITFVT